MLILSFQLTVTLIQCFKGSSLGVTARARGLAPSTELACLPYEYAVLQALTLTLVPVICPGYIVNATQDALLPTYFGVDGINCSISLVNNISGEGA